jgi:hypothetical protein
MIAEAEKEFQAEILELSAASEHLACLGSFAEETTFWKHSKDSVEELRSNLSKRREDLSQLQVEIIALTFKKHNLSFFFSFYLKLVKWDCSLS